MLSTFKTNFITKINIFFSQSCQEIIVGTHYCIASLHRCSVRCRSDKSRLPNKAMGGHSKSESPNQKRQPTRTYYLSQHAWALLVEEKTLQLRLCWDNICVGCLNLFWCSFALCKCALAGRFSLLHYFLLLCQILNLHHGKLLQLKQTWSGKQLLSTAVQIK